MSADDDNSAARDAAQTAAHDETVDRIESFARETMNADLIHATCIGTIYGAAAMLAAFGSPTETAAFLRVLSEAIEATDADERKAAMN
jgi:hypothetical protein